MKINVGNTTHSILHDLGKVEEMLRCKVIEIFSF